MGEWSLIVINRDRKNKLKNYVDYLFSQDDKDMSRREKREEREKREKREKLEREEREVREVREERRGQDRTEGLEK